MNNEALAVESTEYEDELSEDIEIMSPGSMLSKGRKKLSLSTEDVSNRLNFKTNLVDNIENDIFDPALPATFNRGYLRNYAKLVEIDVDEVLNAYDMLSVAKVQRSEMQSFSNLTVKEAEHSRLMWFSYLIVALLFGLMVLWWLQESTLSVDTLDESKQEQQLTNNVSDIADVSVVTKPIEAPKLVSVEAVTASEITKPTDSIEKNLEPAIIEQSLAAGQVDTTVESIVEATVEATTINEAEITTELVADVSTVVFTFSGDCWVNIYDATGDRVAWGVKKSGYVMTVTGKAPLKVTLGKPELAEIAFNGEQVDMSSFNAGNIATFTLPLISQ